MATTIFIPPGGFQGFAEQTIAVKQLIAKAGGRKKRVIRKKRAKKKPVRRTRRRPATPVRSKRKTTRKKKPARLVKGSAAAKRHMAKLRRMRSR